MTLALLPADLELAVLCAVLVDPDTAWPLLDAEGLTWAHFGDPRNGLVFAAMVKLRRQGQAIDPLTLEHILRAAGKLQDAGGVEHIGLALFAVPTAANVGTHARLVREAARERSGDPNVRPEAQQREQVGATRDRLRLGVRDFQRMPWPSLDAVWGGLAPGGVHFVCANSGGGKTSFLLSLMCRVHAQGGRVYYAGLESEPHTLRMQWACRILGYNPGDILTGEYLRFAHAAEMRAKLDVEIARQESDPEFRRVRFAPHLTVDQAAMVEICVEAHHFGADLLVIDHIDHITADGSPYVASRRTTDALLKLAQRHQLRPIVASQLNNDGLSNDPLRNHRPVRQEQIKMGGHKREIAETMWGIYRPLRIKRLNADGQERGGVSEGERKAVLDGSAEIASILEPNCMAFNCLKHRAYGNREGRRVYLGFDHGDVVEAPELTHGITTHRRTFA